MKPVISACIITYNNAPYVAECIESALKQKVNVPYEIVIGEDCSTDKTKEICQDFANRYPDKIRLISNDTNLGLIGNWLKTIGASKGKYVALCEGDDYWIDSLKLQKQVDYMEQHPETSLVHTHGYDLKNKKMIPWRIWVKTAGEVSEIAHYSVIAHTCTVLLKRDLFQGFSDIFHPYSMDKEFLIADWPLFAYLATKGPFGYLNEKTTVYRNYSTQVSSITNKEYLLKYSSSIIKAKRFLRDEIFLDEAYPDFNEDVLRKDYNYLILKFAFGTFNYKVAGQCCSQIDNLNEKALKLSIYTRNKGVFYLACIARKVKRILKNSKGVI